MEKHLNEFVVGQKGIVERLKLKAKSKEDYLI